MPHTPWEKLTLRGRFIRLSDHMAGTGHPRGLIRVGPEENHLLITQLSKLPDLHAAAEALEAKAKAGVPSGVQGNAREIHEIDLSFAQDAARHARKLASLYGSKLEKPPAAVL